MKGTDHWIGPVPDAVCKNFKGLATCTGSLNWGGGALEGTKSREENGEQRGGRLLLFGDVERASKPSDVFRSTPGSLRIAS
jgi:hypothetical protein